MLGHTGNFKAAKKAIKHIDKCAYEIFKATKKAGGATIITADHGNAEQMFFDGDLHTAHTTNPVVFILASEKHKNCNLKDGGKLANVSPTILDILNIEKPKEMEENSLIIY